MISKRCIDCPTIIDHRRTRCDPCEARWEATRGERTPRPYENPAYRKWRKIVRLRAGGRCQNCGKPDDDPRRPHHADHIVAVVDGGARFDPANGQMLCFDCHVEKTAADRRARPALVGRSLMAEGGPRFMNHESRTDDAGPVVG